MEPTDTEGSAAELDRREALALMAAAGGAALLVPTQWTRPLLEWTALPAHADTSLGTGEATGTGTGAAVGAVSGSPTGTAGTGTVGNNFPITVPCGADSRVTIGIDTSTCSVDLASGDTGAADAIVIEYLPADTYAQAIVRGAFHCVSASGWEMTSCYSTQVYGIGYGFDITIVTADDAGNELECVVNMDSSGLCTLSDAVFTQGGC